MARRMYGVRRSNKNWAGRPLDSYETISSLCDGCLTLGAKLVDAGFRPVRVKRKGTG